MSPLNLRGTRVRYEIIAGDGAFFVRKRETDGLTAESAEVTRFRTVEVARAYADAYVALDRYFDVLAAQGDAVDLFEHWRRLDDLYEDLSAAYRDPPKHGSSLAGTAMRPLAPYVAPAIA